MGFARRIELRSVLAVVLAGVGLYLVLGGWQSVWADPRAVFPLRLAIGFVGVVLATLAIPAVTRRRRVLRIVAGGSAVSVAAVLVAAAGGVGATAWLAESVGLEWADNTERLATFRWTAALPMSWAGVIVVGALMARARRYVALGVPSPRSDGQPPPADIELGKDADGYPITLLEGDRFMHVLVAGPTGSGKTWSGLAPMLVQDLANTRVGLTVIEPKGDFVLGDFTQPGIVQWAEHYGRTINVIDPANPRTDVFNPLIGDRHMVAEVNSVGLRTLFGDEVNFFTTAQEALFKKTLYLLKWLRGDHLTYWDLQKTVRDFGMLTTYARELRGRVEYWKRAGLPEHITRDDLEEVEDLVNWFRVEATGDNGDKLKEVTLGLRVQLDNLMNNAYFRRCIVPDVEDADSSVQGRRVIDLDKHLANGSVLAVSTNDGLLAGYSSVLGRMLVTAFQYAASRRFSQHPDKRGPHIICIDEAPTYLSPAWAEFQAKARGFRVGIVLGVQTLSQLDRIERGFTETIVGQCRTRVIYGGLPPKDIKYWLDAFGTKKVEEVTWNESRRNLPVGTYFDLLGPIGYHQVTSGKNTRLADKTRVEFNEIWELPRGRVIIQRVVRGNVQPPGIATVAIVKTLPPKVGTNQQISPEAGLAVLQDPGLPAIPPGALPLVLDSDKPQRGRERGRGRAGRADKRAPQDVSRSKGGQDIAATTADKQEQSPPPSVAPSGTVGSGQSVMGLLVGRPQGAAPDSPTTAGKPADPSLDATAVEVPSAITGQVGAEVPVSPPDAEATASSPETPAPAVPTAEEKVDVQAPVSSLVRKISRLARSGAAAQAQQREDNHWSSDGSAG